jgi:hypothetical protein
LSYAKTPLMPHMSATAIANQAVPASIGREEYRPADIVLRHRIALPVYHSAPAIGE